MAEDNRNTESFALGIIIAVVVFLLLRREFGRLGKGGGCGCGGSGAGNNGATGCTKCQDGCDASNLQIPPVNPGITPGISLEKPVYGVTFTPNSSSSGYSPAPVSIFG